MCRLTYGCFQGKKESIEHFKDKKVTKSHNNKVKPVILTTRKVNQNEVKEILDKYYRKRFKEKSIITENKLKEEEKLKSESEENITSGQMELCTPSTLETKFEEKESDPQDLQKVLKVSEKRKSQNTAQNNTILEENKPKRAASDDDKEGSIDDDKNGSKIDSLKFKFKLSLKNIALTSRGNFNSPN